MIESVGTTSVYPYIKDSEILKRGLKGLLKSVGYRCPAYKKEVVTLTFDKTLQVSSLQTDIVFNNYLPVFSDYTQAKYINSVSKEVDTRLFVPISIIYRHSFVIDFSFAITYWLMRHLSSIQRGVPSPYDNIVQYLSKFMPCKTFSIKDVEYIHDYYGYRNRDQRVFVDGEDISCHPLLKEILISLDICCKEDYMSCFKYHPEYGHINELKYGHVFLPKGLNPDFLDSLKYVYSESI